MDLTMPILVFLLLACAFVLLWFGFFIVHRSRLRLAMFASGLAVFGVAVLLIFLGLGFTTN
jgi:hypothetical protein